MNTLSTVVTLKKLIAELAKDSGLNTDIRDDTNIINDTGLDSIQMINLLLSIEENFDIQFDYENFELSILSSVKIFAGYIDSLLCAQ